MAISIKNVETEQVARQLASLTGESLTDAIRVAVEERYQRIRDLKSKRRRRDELRALAHEYAQLPDAPNMMTDDEILGYDEFGAPTR